jgi:hypothetical protein
MNDEGRTMAAKSRNSTASKSAGKSVAEGASKGAPRSTSSGKVKGTVRKSPSRKRAPHQDAEASLGLVAVAPAAMKRSTKVDNVRVPRVSAQVYVDSVLDELRAALLPRVARLAETGRAVPAPSDLADLLGAGLPAAGVEVALDEHVADVGPFYDSAGARLQLGLRTKQALDSRRNTQTVLAMQTRDGTWLYPAWQFTGDGSVHQVLLPVLKALRGMDRWQVGVWLVSEHPDMGGISPRQALRDGVDPAAVARVAAHDKAALAA